MVLTILSMALFMVLPKFGVKIGSVSIRVILPTYRQYHVLRLCAYTEFSAPDAHA